VRATGAPTSTARLATATKPEDRLAVGEESPPSRQAIATVRQSRSILCGCASAPPSCATPQPAQLAEAKVSYPAASILFVWMPVYLLWCLCCGKDMDMRPLSTAPCRSAPRSAPMRRAHQRSCSPSQSFSVWRGRACCSGCLPVPPQCAVVSALGQPRRRGSPRGRPCVQRDYAHAPP
jgi:hypothetical protein